MSRCLPRGIAEETIKSSRPAAGSAEPGESKEIEHFCLLSPVLASSASLYRTIQSQMRTPVPARSKTVTLVNSAT